MHNLISVQTARNTLSSSVVVIVHDILGGTDTLGGTFDVAGRASVHENVFFLLTNVAYSVIRAYMTE